jgi:hypothetical protein
LHAFDEFYYFANAQPHAKIFSPISAKHRRKINAHVSRIISFSYGQYGLAHFKANFSPKSQNSQIHAHQNRCWHQGMDT